MEETVGVLGCRAAGLFRGKTFVSIELCGSGALSGNSWPSLKLYERYRCLAGQRLTEKDERQKKVRRNTVAGVLKERNSPGATQWPVTQSWVFEDLLDLFGTVREVHGPSGSVVQVEGRKEQLTDSGRKSVAGVSGLNYESTLRSSSNRGRVYFQ